MVPLYRHGGGKGPAVTLVADQTLASVRPSPYPDGTGHVPATGDPQPTRDDTSATIHPVPGSSVFWGESVSAPSVPWFVDLAPTMWARRGRRKEAEPLPAVRALHLPREDLPERPRSHQVTAGAFLQRRAPAALVPRWPSQDADGAKAGSGARESRSSRSRADAAPARGLRPSRPDQMLRPR